MAINKERNAQYQHTWYLKNKQTQMDRVKTNRQRLQQEVSKYKESNPCTDCNMFYPSCVMDFDHISNDKYKNVSMLVRAGSRDKIWEEISKCELVCANCHRLRTQMRYRKL